jgi:hypothetical protein
MFFCLDAKEPKDQATKWVPVCGLKGRRIFFFLNSELFSSALAFGAAFLMTRTNPTSACRQA